MDVQYQIRQSCAHFCFGCASGVYNWCFSGEAAGMAASLIQDAGFLQNAGCWTPFMHCMLHSWLVVSTYPSEKSWSSSVGIGMMKFPTEWKVIKNVPNHQPDSTFKVNIMTNMVNHETSLGPRPYVQTEQMSTIFSK